VVTSPERDRLQQRLREWGVMTAIHYPTTIHRQEAYLHLGYPAGSFPVAERLAGQILSLPLYPELSLEEVDQVCEALIESV
jgi:dTDP-4-amino-4,6-dideoxygalactose transaminase